MKKIWFFLWAMCWSSIALFSQSYRYDFNEKCDEAYEKIMSFKVLEGLEILKEQQQKDPYNLIPFYVENYDDFIVLMFNGDAAEYAKRKKNLDIRISKMNKGSSKDPWYNFTKSNMYLQWAIIKIRFGDYLAAANDFRKSYQLIKENKALFPSFQYNNIVYGLEETIVGTVPDKYKWISAALGMKGDVKKGNGKLVTFLNARDGSADHLRAEAIFYYVYINHVLIADHEGIWNYLELSQLDYKNNHLFAFMKANVALGMNKAASAEYVLKNRTINTSYLKVPLLDYYIGVAQYYYNSEACVASFQKFLDQSKGKMFEKDALQKLSIYYLVNNKSELSLSYKNAIKTKGNTLIEADKQAERYASSTTIPNKDLMLSRMYADGGYWSKSQQILAAIQESNILDVGNKVEYYYRYAKVYGAQKNWDKAISFYQKTIDLGANRQEHFAARSCLELGDYYEKKGQKTVAVSYYKKCLEMKNHDYKSSLDQKAKAGLNRLGQST